MALVITPYYYEYFVWDRRTSRWFERGYVSYFDPTERCFLRINPSEGDTAQEHWIPLPVIKGIEFDKKYLRFKGYEDILQDYTDLDLSELSDEEFEIEVVRLADKYGFEDSMWAYATCCWNEIILKWIEENNIPNCKINGRPYWVEYDPFRDPKEHAKRILDFGREQRRLEEQQEEEFKKTLLKK